MKFLSIDFETTGLDPKVNQPLAFCGILDYVGNKTPIEELPRFHCYFAWDTITVHHVAGKMNHTLVEKLFNQDFGPKHIEPREFSNQLRIFLNTYGVTGKITIAGKNPNFDAGFCVALGFTSIEFRMIDPAILYMRPEDEKVPGLATCLKRAGLDVDVTEDHFKGGIHNEAYDAESIIRLLRKYYQ